MVRFLFMGKMSRSAIFMVVKYLRKVFLVMGEPGLTVWWPITGLWTYFWWQNKTLWWWQFRLRGGRTLCFFSNMRWAGGILAFIFPWIHTWLVVKQPLWKIWKSVGMIIPNIWKKMFQTTNQTQYVIYFQRLRSLAYAVDATLDIVLVPYIPGCGDEGQRPFVEVTWQTLLQV